MITIIGNANSWPWSKYDHDRLKQGDHSGFKYAEKSVMCEFCGNITSFYSGGSLGFCLSCNKDIPKADELFDKLQARVEYHFGRKY